jgi:NAD(P)-dependent dehydrogenase (short-subunit alcohol dehydrogenase family)
MLAPRPPPTRVRRRATFSGMTERDRALEERHVLVVGGSSGIGLGVARACLDEGARVTLAGRSAERLAQARAALDAGERVATFAADVGAEAEVARLVEQAGPLDHVVTTAVDAAYQRVPAMELEVARRAVASKLLGPLLLAKHCAGRLGRGGSLVFTSGIAAHRPSPGGALVAALNAGLAALAGALAVELAPVRVNVVSPGWVDTPVWERLAGARRAEVLAERAARNPVGRVGTPDDLGRAVVFLLVSPFVTGATLEVDGGHRWS